MKEMNKIFHYLACLDIAQIQQICAKDKPSSESLAYYISWK